MLAVAFDTLKLARKFEAAGFPPKQAQDASAALAESFVEWQTSINLATRDDLLRVEQKLENKIQQAEDKIRESELRVVIRLGSMIVGLGGLLIAIKFFG